MLKNLGFDMTSSAKKENGGTSEQEEIGETTGGQALLTYVFLQFARRVLFISF